MLQPKFNGKLTKSWDGESPARFLLSPLKPNFAGATLVPGGWVEGGVNQKGPTNGGIFCVQGATFPYPEQPAQ